MTATYLAQAARRPACALASLAAALAATFAVSAAWAQQGYPSKPIRMVTPYAPGGSTSVASRMIGDKFTEAWGQQVIVDPRGGGNTTIGTENVARSPADGYNLIFVAMTHVVVPQLQKASYDPLKDFAPVATFDLAEEMLVVTPSLPANNVKEYIALARAKPGAINFGHAGTGGANHLAGEFFANLVGVKLQHVPYKGSSQVMTDLMGGQVQSSFLVPVNAISQVKAGKLRALAVSGPKRLTALPQVPTFTEAGVANYDAGFWRGVLAPAATPKPIIDKLTAEIQKITGMPDIVEKLHSLGQEPFYRTPEQFAELMRADYDKYGKLVKAANIKLEE
jgi:tripartite-type tricarboxylate transporter receptor subunit TctC